MRILTGVMVLAILGALVLACGCTTQSDEQVAPEGPQTITVGIMGPFTGDAAIYGQGAKKGADLAFDEAGLDNVELVYEDSLCTAKDAANAVSKLIDIDGVDAIVGELCSGATLAAAPAAEQNQVVMISPGSTSPDVTDAGDYIFRTIPSDAKQGAYAAELMMSMGYGKLALLYTNDDYGAGLSSVLNEEFVTVGGEVVADETFARGSVDVRTQLAKIKEAGPDAIYIVSNSPDANVAVLQQIAELDIQAQLYGSEGLMGPEVSGLGAPSDGVIITSVSAGSPEFVDSYVAFYGEEPGPFAAQGYDAAWAIINAIEGGATTGEEIKDALYEMEFEGATGTVKFDENGDVIGGYVPKVVQNGEFVELKL
jgi:branched-chain amino acid transport system substrate-binding protein